MAGEWAHRCGGWRHVAGAAPSTPYASAPPYLTPFLPTRYENGESRTLVLTDGGAAPGPDPTWFPGGHAGTEPQQALLRP